MQEEKKVTVEVQGNVSNQGAIAFSLNPKVAKKEWKLRDGEVVAVKPSEVWVLDENEKKGRKKGDWYLFMTNQRFVVSKYGSGFMKRLWHAIGLQLVGGLLAGLIIDSVIKGTPVYAIPFENIVTCNMEKGRLTITTKDGNSFSYDIHGKEKQFNKQIQELFG